MSLLRFALRRRVVLPARESFRSWAFSSCRSSNAYGFDLSAMRSLTNFRTSAAAMACPMRNELCLCSYRSLGDRLGAIGRSIPDKMRNDLCRRRRRRATYHWTGTPVFRNWRIRPLSARRLWSCAEVSPERRACPDSTWPDNLRGSWICRQRVASSGARTVFSSMVCSFGD